MCISRGSLLGIFGMRSFGLVVSLTSATVTLAGPITSAPEAPLPVFAEDGPRRSVVQPDGSVALVESRRVWRPICGSDLSGATNAELQELAAASRLARAGREPLRLRHPHGGSRNGRDRRLLKPL